MSRTTPSDRPRPPRVVDQLDLQILALLVDRPRAGVREYARQLEVARGTVQARLDRLVSLGVIADFAPTISPSGLGHSAKAYVRLNLAQGVLDKVIALLSEVPEIVEVDSIAGESDIVCQVVSTGPENLEEVVQRILAVPGVIRTRTEVVLRRRIERRVRPLLDEVARDLRRTGGGR